jgi:hypothetical protein
MENSEQNSSTFILPLALLQEDCNIIDEQRDHVVLTPAIAKGVGSEKSCNADGAIRDMRRHLTKAACNQTEPRQFTLAGFFCYAGGTHESDHDAFLPSCGQAEQKCGVQ